MRMAHGRLVNCFERWDEWTRWHKIRETFELWAQDFLSRLAISATFRRWQIFNVGFSAGRRLRLLGAIQTWLSWMRTDRLRCHLIQWAARSATQARRRHELMQRLVRRWKYGMLTDLFTNWQVGCHRMRAVMPADTVHSHP